MQNQTKIVIVKLGGSLISNKAIPYSVNGEIIDRIALEIKQFSDISHFSLIIVHGGGSFGHPMAYKYAIHKGYSKDIPIQIDGLLKTHRKMLDLNHILVNSFIAQGLKVFSLPPSVVFMEKNGSLVFSGKQLIEELLEWQIIPILFGDILFTDRHNFKILSGDTIIQHLCAEFGSQQVEKVIFTFDQDGILKKSEEGQQFGLVYNLNSSELKEFKNSWNNFDSGEKYDVTGSLAGKIEKILKIVDMDITVKLINGNVPYRLLDTLLDKETISTTIIK